MCGIFGYIGNKNNAGEIVLNGLKLLEYRGYDSWGVAIKKVDGEIYLEKHVGKIGTATLPNVPSHFAIGHTRWATHGGVTQTNAHPQTDEASSVIVVHNGIVENYETLKSELVSKGHTFSSETDTEIIAHLIEEMMKTHSVFEAIHSVRQQLKGMNAVIAFLPNENTFAIFKNGSPVVIGKQDSEIFIASDSSALISHTKNAYFVEDDDLVLIQDNSIQRFDIQGNPVKLTFVELEYSAESASLGKYTHFMLKEIHEQPSILQSILNSHQDSVSKAKHEIENTDETMLIGCGTASYACLAGTYLFSKIAKRNVTFSIASEFEYLLNFISNRSLVLALSQSGETIDVIASIKKAKERKARILTMVNVLGSTLYRMADEKILLTAGPERAVASTKAFTAKIALLYLIAHELAGSQKEGYDYLSKAVESVKHVLTQQNHIQKIAQDMKTKKHIFVLGRGISYPASLEVALKIKEVSYIHAEGFAAGELKHGVIALIEKGTPVILFNPQDETYEDTLSGAHEVKARGAHVIGVSSKRASVYDEFIHVDQCNNATIIPNVVVGQLLGYYVAVSKGLDPDKPRNLAKSVTVK